MAVAFDRKIGEATGTASPSIDFAGVSSGEFIVLWVACDNTAGTNLPTISSVVHNVTSQTYTVLASHGSTSTSANAATRGFIVIIPSFSPDPGPGTLLSVSFSASPSKSVMVAAAFTGVSSTAAGASASSNTNPSTISPGGVASGDLILSLSSCEDNGALTLDADFTEPGGDGAVFTTGGGAAANVSMMAGYRIAGASANSLTSSWTNDGGHCVIALEPAASGIDLVVADSAHAHSAETPTLTQVHSAVVADATHAHAADNVGLTQAHSVVVADSSHGHTADNVAVAVVTNLVVADSTHGHTADNIAVTQAHSVAVQEASHAHASDNVSITQVHGVVVAESAHAHTADNVAIVQNSNLVIADALHGHTADNVAVTVVSALVIADATHGHTADGPTITQVHAVVVADALHGHTVDNVVIQAGTTLVITDALHAHSADNIGLTQVHILVLQESSHAHLGDGPITISAGDILNVSLFVADGHHHHSADSPSLSQVHILTLQEALHLVDSDLANVDENTPVYILILATTPEHYRFPEHAVDRVGVALGITVYRKQGTWYTGRNLRPSALEGADLVYRGGYENVVEDPAVRAELQALGYTFETRYI